MIAHVGLYNVAPMKDEPMTDKGQPTPTEGDELKLTVRWGDEDVPEQVSNHICDCHEEILKLRKQLKEARRKVVEEILACEGLALFKRTNLDDGYYSIDDNITANEVLERLNK